MSLQIQPVRGRRELRRFLDTPWALSFPSQYPKWTPPLRALVRDAVDERRNPFYREAERELFLARRGSRTVGRIAAIRNSRHNAFHGDRVGFFGFFEAENDPEAAAGLVSAATEWLSRRGLDRIRGPMSPSTNHECGLLVSGFEQHATFMTPWNPPYYGALLEGTGLRPARDLLGFWIPGSLEALPERYARVAQRARERSSFTFRLIDLRRFAEEAERVWKVYNEAWERNWGFVPMSRAEFDHMADMLRHLIVEEFGFFAEIDGEPAAFALTLPDYNVTMRRIPSGRLWPLGLLKLLRDRRRLRRGRILLLGVRERFRSRAIYFQLIDELLRRGRAYGGAGAEASWILDDNESLLNYFRAAGLPETKRWRIYESEISVK